jgi:N-acetylglucosaminyldiphosphoundecaprenol N-acetyl-beta-D-mannosaminyltransferase
MYYEENSKDKRLIPRVMVIGIPMYAHDIQGVIDIIVSDSKAETTTRPRCISATGAHGLVTAQKDPNFRQTLQGFFLNLPDGKPSVWVGRLKGAKAMQRCYGPDFFAALMRATAGQASVRHYFCGGLPGVADQLKDACATKFGNPNVVGTYSPPFRTLSTGEFQDLGDQIDLCGTDIVWIGISTPKQELFAAELAKHTKAGFIITVGAAFDFHTGRVRQAPAWTQKAGLEWMFRLVMEPKRLYRRYLEIVPAFILYSIRDLLNSRRQRYSPWD